MRGYIDPLVSGITIWQKIMFSDSHSSEYARNKIAYKLSEQFEQYFQTLITFISFAKVFGTEYHQGFSNMTQKTKTISFSGIFSYQQKIDRIELKYRV